MRFVSEWICVGQGDISEGKSRLPTCSGMWFFFLFFFFRRWHQLRCHSRSLSLATFEKREQICGCVKRGEMGICGAEEREDV